MINTDYIDYKAKLGFIAGLCVGLNMSSEGGEIRDDVAELLYKYGNIGIKHLFENLIDDPRILSEASDFFDRIYSDLS